MRFHTHAIYSPADRGHNNTCTTVKELVCGRNTYVYTIVSEINFQITAGKSAIQT